MLYNIPFNPYFILLTCIPSPWFFTLKSSSWFTKSLICYLPNPFATMSHTSSTLPYASWHPSSINIHQKLLFFHLQLPPVDLWNSILAFCPYSLLHSYITSITKTLCWVVKLCPGMTLHSMQIFLSNFLMKKKSICEHATHFCRW